MSTANFEVSPETVRPPGAETPPAGPIPTAPLAVDPSAVTPLSAAAAAFGGWMVFAVADLGAVALRAARPARVWQLVYELGNCLAAGLLAAGLVLAWLFMQKRLWPKASGWRRTALAGGLLAALALAVGFLVLPVDLASFANRWHLKYKYPPRVVRPLLISIIALGIPGAWLLFRLLAQPLFRWAGLGLGFALAVANFRLLKSDYWNGHLMLTWLAATTAGVSLTGLAVPSALVPGRWARRAMLASAVALAAWSVLIPPRPSRIPLLRLTQGRPFTSLEMWHGYRRAQVPAQIPPEQAAWFKPRTAAPAVPSSSPETDDKPIVLLLTIDSLRQEVVNSREYDDMIPTMASIRDNGVHFKNAISPGSQTVYSMTAWFTGKYFSQLKWTPNKAGMYWPAKDKTERFPKLLHKAKVSTHYLATGWWLNPQNGVVRGFKNHRVIRKEKKHNNFANATEAADVVIDTLRKHGSGPLFAFTHFMDTHYPYPRAKKGGGQYKRYLREARNIDLEIKRIRDTVRELGLENRTTIIISADHGDAFGEHGTRFHGVSVYQELIHIPLLVEGPGYKKRTVEELVSTIDFGPTILDVFGRPTPGKMMGQSLLPLLRGGPAPSARPVASENRLSQTMLFPNGLKVIRDLRFGGAEAYNLKTDPEERRNLVDDPSVDTSQEFARLDAFFDAHTLKTLDYEPPFRR